MDTDKNGKWRNVPKNQTDFYVRFSAPETVKKVKLKLNFGYLESCVADVNYYEGWKVNWSWSSNTRSQTDENGNVIYDAYGNTTTEYQYTLKKEVTQSPTQRVAGFTDLKTMQYRTDSLIIPAGNDEIDITMHLAGRVFLDQPQGKNNEINNTYDKGEELKGIDVTLFDSNDQIVAMTLTDKYGEYRFDDLNAMKKYYVRFGYNGILYTNVEYKRTGANNSKAREEEQGHKKDREKLNSLFSEIGSYPENYKIGHKVFKNDLGDYNKVYLQEEVSAIYKEVAKEIVRNGGDELAAYRTVAGNDLERKRKVQFVADSRIYAYTVTQYPRLDIFVTQNRATFLEGKLYPSIYPEQEYVNLGIKSRPTFDLALYKDVVNAEVKINGKSEIYKYDSRFDTDENKGFRLGINESDYQMRMRQDYQNDKDPEIQSREVVNPGSYEQYIRAEEIVNGDNTNNSIDSSRLFEEEKGYAWRGIQSKLTEDEKLKIYVTYQLAIRNQSSIPGSVTELVDYYDKNYQFETAYLGDSKGQRIEGSEVKASKDSIYSDATMYKTDKYNTIYLVPSVVELSMENKEMYIYVTFSLVQPEQTLINAGLLKGDKLETLNFAEINGYKNSLGVPDQDSIPGNLDPNSYQYDPIDKTEKTRLEDDESPAPALIYSLKNSRTIEGTVFEDSITSLADSGVVNTKGSRFGSGTLDENDPRIQDVIVELIEVKGQNLFVRATTTTNDKGWYGFGAFVPGEYVVRFTYGSDQKTALTKETKYHQGSNDRSYNGQDYQSTTYTTKDGQPTNPVNYEVDQVLQNRVNQNNEAGRKNNEEVLTVGSQPIIQYMNQDYYWYADSSTSNQSDAIDNEERKQQVIAYSNGEYGKDIINHKAEVFNAYNQEQPNHVTEELHEDLSNELARRTYRYAYTAQMPVEVEYTKKVSTGNQKDQYHITGVDFGVVERPRAKLTLRKNVSHIKVITPDGNVLFDTDKKVDNLAWDPKENRYDIKPDIQIIMDEENISGAQLEITYKLTVTNEGEIDSEATTGAKNVVDYVTNNLTFSSEDPRNEHWKVVTKDQIQNNNIATLVNNADSTENPDYKEIDLSTKQTILQTTENNPLTDNLKPGESTSATLVLRKVLSMEGIDDLYFDNIAEIVEVKNSNGRYDHTSVPGNQKPDSNPAEEDTDKAENVMVILPFGSKPTYYVIGLVVAIILAGGVYFIKKKVIDEKKK